MSPHHASPRKLRILVVDDEPSFTRLLKINLELTERYIVAAENDPHQALETALDFGPDLVLLDVMMPGVDGGDIADRFSDHDALADVPVVFLTATVTKSEVDERNGRFGGMCFLAKPIDLAGLQECLEKQFAERSLTAG